MNDTITMPRSVVEQALMYLGDEAPVCSGCVYEWTQAIKVLRAALEQPDIGITTSVPSGWKLVPVDPADSQIRAAQDTWWHACNCETYWDQIYVAMIDAAPKPPVVEQPQAVTDCHQSQPQGEQEPDWTNSETGLLECWKNPLYPMPDRLRMADGAVAFRDKTIANLRLQLAAYQSAQQLPAVKHPSAVKPQVEQEPNAFYEWWHMRPSLTRLQAWLLWKDEQKQLKRAHGIGGEA